LILGRVDPWQALVDDELERDGRQKQNERRLESILSQTLLYAERQTRQTADRRLVEYTDAASISRYHVLTCSSTRKL